MRRIVVLLIALLAAPLSATPSLSEVEAYRALIAQDLRLAITGYRLAQANSPFCPSKERNPGWVIHDVAQYPDMHAARTAFGFDRPVQIAAIVKGGAADQAGLSEGDAFIGLDDATLYWPAMPVGKTGYERMASFKQLLNEKWGEKPQMPMQISRAGHLFNTVIKPPLVCASDFQVDTRDGLDAGADGQIVRITYAMMEYVRNDDELAAVVAHEFSHNILGHRKRLNKQGVSRGLGRLFGKSKDAFLATEVEADRLSVWLMANAGYRPDGAISFWERYGREHGQGIFTEGTHPRWKHRVKLLQLEIDEITIAHRNGGVIMPPLLAGVGAGTAN